MKQFNLEEYKKNPNRKVITRDGKSVRIVCTDMIGTSYPILVVCRVNPTHVFYFLIPTQFKIVDVNPHFFSLVAKGLPKPKQLTLHSVNKKDPYARILIQKI